MIGAAHLTRRFGPRTVVDDVSFEVAPGEIVALLGPNGAGKTTTMRMLAGLIAPSSGTVTIAGIALSAATGSLARSRIGFLTETPGLWERLTVVENLRVYARLHGLDSVESTVDRAIDTFELTAQRDVRAAELSKGMRQKAALARALLHNPTVLLLDEPTSGLDPEIRRAIRSLLETKRSAGCAILVSTHNLDEAERIADRVAVLHARLVAIDRPASLRGRLTTGRLLVRTVADPAALLPAILRFDAAASVEDNVLALTLTHVERDTPAVVAALVAAGGRIVEVRPEMPALEDVYLHLLGDGR